MCPKLWLSLNTDKIILKLSSKLHLIKLFWLTCPTFDIFLKYIIYDGINILVNILEEEWETILDGQLKLLQEVRVVEGAHLKFEKEHTNAIF